MNEKHNYMPDKQKNWVLSRIFFCAKRTKNVKVPMYERSFDIDKKKSKKNIHTRFLIKQKCISMFKT